MFTVPMPIVKELHVTLTDMMRPHCLANDKLCEQALCVSVCERECEIEMNRIASDVSINSRYSPDTLTTFIGVMTELTDI